MEDRELVGLLYRADWTRLTLSGTVRGGGRVVETTPTVSGWGPAPTWLPGPWRRDESPPVPPNPPDWFFPSPEGAQASRRLILTPGRRFRVESADGSRVLGCDGERLWHWLRDMPPDTEERFDDRPQPPFRTLLVPSWLLTSYSLEVSGPETVCGRTGVRVLATPRAVIEHPRRGLSPRGTASLVPDLDALRKSASEYWDEVDAVVDAQLGILLRCSRRRGDEPPSVSEFEALEVASPAESALFSAPPGSVFGRSRAHPRGQREESGKWTVGEHFGDVLDATLSSGVREAAKNVAGMAAGGLGAVIRYGPSHNPDPFKQATSEEPDPEAAMPMNEPDPDAADGPDGADGAAAARTSPGAVSDEVLYLLYRGGLPRPRFTATLHQWFDVDAVIDAVPQAERGLGFGGVGYLVDALRKSMADSGDGDLHSVSTVRMGGWSTYRIDATRPRTPPWAMGRIDRGPSEGGGSGRRRRGFEPVTQASDGVLRWDVYADRAESRPAGPAPGDLADLLDPSWLLEFELSGGEEVVIDGWPAYRVVARYRGDDRPFFDWWKRLFFPAVAVVDAETGRLVRLTRFKGGRPMLRQELRDIALLPPDEDFAFTPPPDLPVVEPDADSDSGPGEDSWSWSPHGAAESNPAKETADAIRKGVDETVAAARNVWDSFFGGGRDG